MTTAVFFDVDRTLVGYDAPFADLYRDCCRALGVDPAAGGYDHYYARFRERFVEFDGDPYVTAARDHAAEMDLDVDPATLAETFVEREVAAARVPDEVATTVADVGDRHPLGVITNGYGPVQRRKLSSVGLDGHFDAVVAASDVGAVKPDPAIFDHARGRLSADGHVHVGDDADADLGAGDRGFRTVLVGDDHPDADHSVRWPEEFGAVGDVVAGTR